MKKIHLPAGTEHVRFGDLPELITKALHPDDGTDSSAIKYVAARDEVLRALRRAVEAGSIPVFSPLNPMIPHEFPIGDALNRALVTVADLRQFVAPAGVRVEAGEAAPEPEAAPVVAESHGLNVVTGGASGDAVTEKTTYPRGSGCRGATARPEPEPPAHPMADWELWAHMPKATVREAVLLSLGLEPRPPVLTWTQYEAPRSYAEPGREYERRLMLAAAHVDASGPLHPLVTMPSPEDATVSLPEFGAWARGLGWVLPEQFLAMSAAQSQQAPEPQAAPVVAESASGGAEPIEAAPVDRGWVMKRAALAKKHVDQWPTIERDLRDASENGLSKAAKAPGHGEWHESAALDWARQRGKLKDEKHAGPANSVFALAGTQHKIRG